MKILEKLTPKKLIIWSIVFLAFFLFCHMAFASGNELAYKRIVELNELDSASIASGGTSKTTTLTGATASSRCVASAAETATNAVYIRSVVPGTNQVVITTSGDPGASNMDYTVICLN